MSWSPDGTQIVFGSERGGQWQMYTMRPDGSSQSPLPIPAHGNAPAWSPDGRQIAFTSNRDGDDEIWIMSPDGSEQHNLTNNSAWDDNPVWSPDASRVAFMSDRSGTPNVYVMNRDGSKSVNLTHGADLVPGIPTWSPNGHNIAFHAAVAESGVAALAHGREDLLTGVMGVALVVGSTMLIVWRRKRR